MQQRRSPAPAPAPAPTEPSASTPLLAKTLPPSPPESNTIRYDELPEWCKDNPALLTGYRRTLPSYRQCAYSVIGYLHNESGNIWTHLLGALAALLSLYLTFACTRPDSWWHDAHRQGWKAPFSLVWPFPSSFQPSVTAWDAAGFAVFFASAATCLGLSAAFHTMVCHSPRVAFLYNRLDYLGIVVLISGTFVPAVRYGFFCDPHLRNIYIALIYTFSALVTAVTMSDRARTPEFRRLRTWLFIALGLSAVFPVGHAVQRYGLQGASDAIALPWLALGGLLYIVGALFYAERFPERLFVGRCDSWGGSHTIFHVFILAAALAHYGAIVDGFRYWHVERKGQCGVASW